MSELIFNQEGVNKLIDKISNLDEEERKRVSDQIRNNLKCFIFEHFYVSENYQRLLKQIPSSIYKEFAFGIAMAIEEKNWNLIIEFPGGEPGTTARCKKATQTVEVSVGFPSGITITKKIVWVYE